MTSLEPLLVQVEIKAAEYVGPTLRRIVRGPSLYFFLGLLLAYVVFEERSAVLVGACVFFGLGAIAPIVELARIAWSSRLKRMQLLTIDEHGVSFDDDRMIWKVVAFEDNPRAFVISGRQTHVVPKRALSEEQISLVERWFEEKFSAPVSPFQTQPARLAASLVGLGLLFWILYRAISQ